MSEFASAPGNELKHNPQRKDEPAEQRGSKKFWRQLNLAAVPRRQRKPGKAERNARANRIDAQGHRPEAAQHEGSETHQGSNVDRRQPQHALDRAASSRAVVMWIFLHVIAALVIVVVASATCHDVIQNDPNEFLPGSRRLPHGGNHCVPNSSPPNARP